MKTSDSLRIIAAQTMGPIPKRPLGKTGLEVSILGMGGESAIKIKNKETEAIELIQAAYQLGLNYFDTASGYDYSEERIGKALEGKLKEVIIATKCEDRTRDGAWRQLEQSLKRLKTDHINIWQIHHIDDEEELRVALGPDGALSALREAREQGIVDFSGISGHYDPAPLRDAITGVDFDMILMSLNAADVHHRSFIKKLLPEAVKRKMGIVGMKICSRGRIFDPTHLNNMKDAMSYVLTLPVSCVIVGHDNINQLAENVIIAKEFVPLSRNQMDDMEKLTESYAQLALFFRKDYEKFNPFWKPHKKKQLTMSCE